MSKKCPKCGSDNFKVVSKYVDGGIGCKCNDCGELFMLLTLFANITASPEVLADKLVYCIKDFFYCTSGKVVRWTSTISDWDYDTKAEAIAATVAKLKEVEK
jgi:hypothetical protein